MTHAKISQALFQIHSSLTGILMADSPEISAELLERLEDTEEMLNAVRNELALVDALPSPAL
jgi:hypothetical protein